jgi:hypothetical protein
MITLFEINIGFEIIKKHIKQEIFSKKFIFGLVRFFIVMLAWLFSCALISKNNISDSKIGFFIIVSLGCYFFSWISVFNLYKYFGYFLLINPFVYFTESIRSIFFNHNEFLPLGYCLVAILFFTLIFGYFGIKKLKKRLDAI